MQGQEGQQADQEFERSIETTLLAHTGNPMLKDALSLFRKLAVEKDGTE